MGVDMIVAEPTFHAPLAASTLSDEEAAATAELFKALGDPTRVRIVNLIAQSGGAVCACDLNEPVADAADRLAPSEEAGRRGAARARAARQVGLLLAQARRRRDAWRRSPT